MVDFFDKGDIIGNATFNTGGMSGLYNYSNIDMIDITFATIFVFLGFFTGLRITKRNWRELIDCEHLDAIKSTQISVDLQELDNEVQYGNHTIEERKMEFYVRPNQEHQIKLSIEQINKKIASGELDGSEEARTIDSDKWISLDSIDGVQLKSNQRLATVDASDICSTNLDDSLNQDYNGIDLENAQCSDSNLEEKSAAALRLNNFTLTIFLIIAFLFFTFGVADIIAYGRLAGGHYIAEYVDSPYFDGQPPSSETIRLAISSSHICTFYMAISSLTLIVFFMMIVSKRTEFIYAKGVYHKLLLLMIMIIGMITLANAAKYVVPPDGAFVGGPIFYVLTILALLILNLIIGAIYDSYKFGKIYMARQKFFKISGQKRKILTVVGSVFFILPFIGFTLSLLTLLSYRNSIAMSEIKDDEKKFVLITWFGITASIVNALIGTIIMIT